MVRVGRRRAETTAERRLKRQIANAIRDGVSADHGLADFYLRCGTFFASTPLSERDLETMTAIWPRRETSSGLAVFGHCYRNAYKLARMDKDRRLRYVEGLALIPLTKNSELLRGSGEHASADDVDRVGLSANLTSRFVCATHAWCVDAKDRVVDPTWCGGPGFAYLGVVLDLKSRAPELPIIKDGPTGFAMMQANVARQSPKIQPPRSRRS